MFFSDLPDELKLAIFNYCTPPTLLKCTSVCKDWQRLLNDEGLWHQQIDSMADETYERDEEDNRSWKTLYKHHHEELLDIADQLYRVLYAHKPNEGIVYTYAQSVIHNIMRIMNKSISYQALFKALLKKHPDILTRTDNHGHNALHWLAASGYSEEMELFLSAQEQDSEQHLILAHSLLNTRNKDGFTPLHFALYIYPHIGHINLTQIISIGISYGADLTIRDDMGGISFLEDLEDMHLSGALSEKSYLPIRAVIDAQVKTTAAILTLPTMLNTTTL